MNQENQDSNTQVPLSNPKGADSVIDSFKDFLNTNFTDSDKNIRVILNPASGQDDPALKIFNRVFKDAGFEWDLRITQEAGDGTRLAKEAIADGIDIVAVYGGDGSVMEVAAGMLGSEVPMAIIPGGTANVISIELGIPRETEAACALVVSPDRTIQKVDVGMADKTCFMLRTGVGLEAAITETADRQAKDKYGIFAYVFSTIQALTEPEIVTYHLNIDGQEIVSEGLSCVVANSGSLGVAGLALGPEVIVTDGLLDVYVICKADLVSLFSVAASVIRGDINQDNMSHWTGKEITIVSDPPQGVQADGELIGNSPVTVKILPQAIKVIVPQVITTKKDQSAA